MKATVACMFALVVVAIARPDDKYTEKYDNINIDDILNNKRLTEAHVNCLLGKGKCTPEGTELKSHIQEALENNCKNCTKIQKERTRTVIGHLINKEPEHWKALTEKYDPERKYTEKYENELREIKA